MMRRARIAVLVATLILGIRPAADAACAWIVWAQNRDNQYQPIGDAWPSLDECRQMADRLTDRDKRKTFIYSCLPDTIDPRGPKAK